MLRFGPCRHEFRSGRATGRLAGLFMVQAVIFLLMMFFGTVTASASSANLQLSQTATDLVLQPGASGSDLSTLTLTLRNNGPDAAAATVTDRLPAALLYVGAAPGLGIYDEATGIWDVGVLASGAETSLQLQVQVAPGASGCVRNTAVAAAVAPAADPATGDNNAGLVLAALACADLVLENQLVDSDLLVDRMVRVRHEITVVNRGPGPATGIVLKINNYDFSPAQAFSGPSPDLSPIQVPDLAAGARAPVIIADYTVSDFDGSFTVTHALELAAGEPDPDAANSTLIDAYTVRVEDGVVVSGSCFIATAAFGSRFEPEVMALRRFRDRFLLKTPTGRAFTAWYYRVSPPIADYIRGRDGLRAAVRALLMPLVLVIRYPAFAGGALALLAAWVLVLKSRSGRGFSAAP